MHALATMEEVTLVAVPDAVHSGWDPIVLAAPVSLVAPRPSVDGVDGEGIHLSWTEVPTARSYDVESDLAPDFADPRLSSTTTRSTVVAPHQGCPVGHYLRVRARRGDEEGPWSGVVAAVAPPTTFTRCDLPVPAVAPAAVPATKPITVWRSRTPERGDEWLVLRAVQSALLRWCAARGDVVAALALPPSFTIEDVVRHVAVLRGERAAFTVRGVEAPAALLDGVVPALTTDEAFVLGYGAAYHPWPVVDRTGDALRSEPPEGAVLGTYAARALSRGAWLAPARRRLDRTLALVPAVDSARQAALSAAGVNPVAEEPEGFMALTAMTLTREAAVRPVNVRRLIALLRRLAAREGARLVFEPHDRELRRLVQMRFERLLGDLYLRGAFAGATAQEAFEVSTGDAVNPPDGVDAGRLVVEVRIAPARPMEFITVRLVLAGTGEQGAGA
jgi:hypothetical protein